MIIDRDLERRMFKLYSYMEVNMQLEKMKAKNLRTWVDKLTKLLNEETNEHNRAIYSRWLKEAKAEQEARFNRRMNYLGGGSYGKENKTRRIY